MAPSNIMRKQIISADECVSPADYRYWVEAAYPYLSLRAIIKAQCQVEIAIAETLVELGHRDPVVLDEIRQACDKVTAEAVYAEEARIRHDVQGLVNCINTDLSDRAVCTVHYGATSYDIICTADAYRYKWYVQEVFLPLGQRLLVALSDQVDKHAETLQMGRSHLQHATPSTFGHLLAWSEERIGVALMEIEKRANELVGKYSGPVGVHSGLSTVFDNPREVERQVMSKLGLLTGRISTQVVLPGQLLRLFQEFINLMTEMADLAENLRLLSATEIGEISEPFAADQVGSSGMPHKDSNPISYENTFGSWEVVMPRLITFHLSMISNLQRDLRNSMPMRTVGETFNYVHNSVITLVKAIESLKVNVERCTQNFGLKGDLVMAEQVKLILMDGGHPNAYRVSQELAKKAASSGSTLFSVLQNEAELQPYLAKATERQMSVLQDPKLYIGDAPLVARRVAKEWRDWASK